MNIKSINYTVTPYCFNEEGGLEQTSATNCDIWCVFRESFVDDQGHTNTGWLGDFATKAAALEEFPGAK